MRIIYKNNKKNNAFYTSRQEGLKANASARILKNITKVTKKVLTDAHLECYYIQVAGIDTAINKNLEN